MRWPLVAASIALVAVTTGCDKINIPFLGGDSDTTAADTTAAADSAAAADTVEAPDTTGPATDTTPPAVDTTRPAPDTARPAAQPARRPQRTRPLVDEPWTPTDTGTIEPGMTRMEVIARWGPPVAERQAGSRTYLYFRNGCEVTCGTFDVVFLEGDQVVDAIVRGVGHNYAGVSSSPRDRAAEFTPPRRPGGTGSGTAS